MRSLWHGLLRPLGDLPLTRRVLHTLHMASNRRLLAQLDAIPGQRRQMRTLLSLVHHARQTPFGLDHDFGRIRTPHDFRRLVPIRRLVDFARFAPQPGSTWPASATEDGVSPWVMRSHRQALSTALALIGAARPATSLLSGALYCLDEDTLLPGYGADRFPLLARPAVCTAQDGDRSPTCIVGSAERIVTLAHQVKTARGEDQPERLWPDLEAIVYTRRDPSVSVEALRQAVGTRPMLLEMLTRPEGPIALEDPRFSSLRLLADAGVYFEFVEAGPGSDINPPRIGLDEVSVGVPYELIVTAPTGIWAGRVGLSVCFDRIDPPLMRVLTPAVPPVVIRSDAAMESVQAPHRSSAGILAALPGTFAHSPWSARADRE